jgi:hypothetical protein
MMRPMDHLPDPMCGDCKAFYMEARDENGTVRGLCRLRPELGELPAAMDFCHLFRVRDARLGRVKEVALKADAKRPGRWETGGGSPEPTRATLADPVTGETTGEIAMDRDGLKQVLRELLEEETMYGYPEMGNRWRGGTMVLKPGAEESLEKDLPIEMLFHKIVMIRDRLRVLEAKINSHEQLGDQDKVELQGYISKCYGTLTTFNILFKDKSDHFTSK